MSYRVSIELGELHALFDIRGHHDILPLLFESLQLPFPRFPNQQLLQGSIEVIRIGRSRCLLRAPIAIEYELETRLKTASDPLYANASLISDMYQVISVDGVDAEDVICQVTPLDLHKLAVESTTATELFGLAGFITKGAGQSFRLYFESSYLDYAMRRIRKCALIETA